jgi:hypothetical protein
VHVTSVLVIGVWIICRNSQGNDSLNENIAGSVFGCCMINSSTEFIKSLLKIRVSFLIDAELILLLIIFQDIVQLFIDEVDISF